MALTQLDETTALVVIDLQRGIVAMPAVPHSAVDVVQRTRRLAQVFRQKGLPVVVVNVAGRAPGRTDAGVRAAALPEGWADVVPELKELGDHFVTKHRPGAFLGTDLDGYLKGRHVTQIVLTGVATSVGVEATARSAFDLGYHVTVVGDAVSDLDGENHRHSLEKVFPRLSEVTTTEVVLEFLNRT